MLTIDEINSLRFYQGDVQNYKINSESDFIKYRSVFYGTKHAYLILNMLLYPGISNEITRICNEQKKLPIHLLENIPEILMVYKNIFSAMCKYQKSHKKENIHAFRKDRMQSKIMLSKNYSFSFTSCSLEDICDDYFLKKDGILLLEYDISSSLPHIILNDVIIDSSFQYQNEILLPPFLAFEKKQINFSEKEKSYRDINNEPPKEKYLLKGKHMLFDNHPRKLLLDGDENIDSISHELIIEDVEYAVSILNNIGKGSVVKNDDIIWYSKWKKRIRNIVYEMLLRIYEDFYFGQY